VTNEANSTNGLDLLAGLDEVGTGALAGPIAIGVVVFRQDARPIPGVTDSKQLTAAKRRALAPIIVEQAVYVGIGWASASVIDSLGLAEAWRRAALDALEKMPTVQALYIDGIRAVDGYRGQQHTIIKGDATMWQIGAASIVAKVLRDQEMFDMAKHFPGYGFERSVGYGTNRHIQALRKLGLCPLHRRTFTLKTLR